MAITNCKECGYEMSTKAVACPKCGAHRPKASIWPWLFGVPLAGLGTLLLLGSLSGPPSAQSSQRRAIQLCWENQGRKSLDPATARFAAGACEQMEADYRRTYGSNP